MSFVLPTDVWTVFQIAQQMYHQQTIAADEPSAPPATKRKIRKFDRCLCGHPYSGHHFKLGHRWEAHLNPCEMCSCSYFELLKMPAWITAKEVVLDGVDLAAWRAVDQLERGRAALADLATLPEHDIQKARKDGRDRQRRAAPPFGQRATQSETSAATPQTLVDGDVDLWEQAYGW